MRIAVTGAYGSGKSTLSARLAGMLGRRYDHVPPMAEPLGQVAKQATECSRDELFELLVRRLMDRAAVEFRRGALISDGSLIHDWVFVRALLMHGANPPDDINADPQWQITSLEPVRRAIHARMRGLYDVVVHLPIEFRLGPGAHPVSEKFRELSDVYLLHELECSAVPVLTVSGEMTQRVEQCLSALKTTTPHEEKAT